MERRNDRDPGAGFTLIEVILGISVLLICTLALGLSLQAGAVAARELREEQVILSQSQSLLNRIISSEFGHDYDPDPTAAQLEELFDNDLDAGDITLWQLTRWPTADGGWRFSLGDFPVDGEWRVRVDRDLNGNDLEDSDLEAGRRIFRVNIFFNDRLILQTNRSKEVTL